MQAYADGRAAGVGRRRERRQLVQRECASEREQVADHKVLVSSSKGPTPLRARAKWGVLLARRRDYGHELISDQRCAAHQGSVDVGLAE
jgi:hypothetical protein